MKVYEPLEIFEGSEEIVNPLTILEGFDNSGSVEINDPIDMIDEDPQSIYNKTMVRPKSIENNIELLPPLVEENNTSHSKTRKFSYFCLTSKWKINSRNCKSDCGTLEF